MTIRVIEWYNSHLKIKRERERERDVLELLKKICNFILFKIYDYVVQRFLNVNINFYFILFLQNFWNENIKFYFILFTQNFQVERTINWPKANLRKEQRNFRFGNGTNTIFLFDISLTRPRPTCSHDLLKDSNCVPRFDKTVIISKET